MVDSDPVQNLIYQRKHTQKKKQKKKKRTGALLKVKGNEKSNTRKRILDGQLTI